jgi:DNA-binding transcriptional LysR family regulator
MVEWVERGKWPGRRRWAESSGNRARPLIDNCNERIDAGNAVAEGRCSGGSRRRYCGAMNIHHLELFYFVARHGGISAAVRHIPYGIQQPAVSSQILRLEEDLGVTLFQRRPFRLTAEGQELLAFIRPFFDNVDAVGMRLRKALAPELRLGAAELVLRDHLPAVIQRVRRKHPGVRLALRSGFQPEIEAWLENGQIDLAVVPRRKKLPPRIKACALMALPLVLLVHRSSPIKDASTLWRKGSRTEPLICLPATEAISLLFQNGLKQRGVNWPVEIEASSMESVTHYVAGGEGVGVSVLIPDVVEHPLVRVLPLEGFEPLELTALWRGKPSPLVRTALEEIQAYVRETWPG